MDSRRRTRGASGLSGGSFDATAGGGGGLFDGDDADLLSPPPPRAAQTTTTAAPAALDEAAALEASHRAALRDTAAALARGVRIGRHRHMLTVYENTFTGADGVAWMVAAGYARDVFGALALGNELIAAGLLCHARDASQPFKNKSSLYRLAMHGGTGPKGTIVVTPAARAAATAGSGGGGGGGGTGGGGGRGRSGSDASVSTVMTSITRHASISSRHRWPPLRVVL